MGKFGFNISDNFLQPTTSNILLNTFSGNTYVSYCVCAFKGTGLQLSKTIALYVTILMQNYLLLPMYAVTFRITRKIGFVNIERSFFKNVFSNATRDLHQMRLNLHY